MVKLQPRRIEAITIHYNSDFLRKKEKQRRSDFLFIRIVMKKAKIENHGFTVDS